MCGIVGYVGAKQASPILLEGLRRLEYRGYDSAGIGVLHRGKLRVTKPAGRDGDLRAIVGEQSKRDSAIRSAHTRWATHGAATDVNAHPHTDGRIVLVHNGIIGNNAQLRGKREAGG